MWNAIPADVVNAESRGPNVFLQIQSSLFVNALLTIRDRAMHYIIFIFLLIACEPPHMLAPVR